MKLFVVVVGTKACIHDFIIQNSQIVDGSHIISVIMFMHPIFDIFIGLDF